MSHTPGPWKSIRSIHGPKYRCVQLGSDDRYTTLEMLPADAELIAAAPRLLELAHKYASECADCNGTGMVQALDAYGRKQPRAPTACPDCKDIREIIAAAEGA